MKHLKKITISNARRFSKDVEIDLCNGGNIFLAPNGTGKTTIFEAIEFALTGKVKRLKDLSTLIRDKQEEVEIRIDFDDNKYCEVSYRKNQTPKMKGDHRDLFPSSNIQDIPFQLRLTHLLEQRGSEWFIQIDSTEDAGNLLSKLAIGKELIEVGKTRSRNLNNATRILNDSTNSLNHKIKELEDLKNKVNILNQSKKDYILKPLNIIYDTLQNAHQNFDKNASIEPFNENLSTVISYHSLVSATGLQKKIKNQERLYDLSNLESKYLNYLDNELDIDKTKSSLSNFNYSIAQLNSKLNSLKNKQKELRDNLYMNQGVLNGKLKIKEVFSKKELELSKLSVNLNSIKINKTTIQVLENDLKSIEIDYNNYSMTLENFNTINQRIAINNQENSKLQFLNQIVQDWQNLIDVKKNLELQASETKKQIIANEEVHKILHPKYVEIKNEYEKSKQKLASLKSIADSILSSVRIISSNILEDERTCPVCLADYEPDELRNQINKALNNLDPILESEIELNEILKSKFEDSKIDLEKLEAEKEALAKKSKDVEVHIAEINNEINIKCISKFIDINEISEAVKWLKLEHQEINNRKAHLDLELKNYTIIPTIEEFNSISTKRNKIANDIKNANLNLENLNISSNNISEVIKNFEGELNGHSIQSIDNEILNLSILNESISKEILKLEQELSRLNSEKVELEQKLTALNSKISDLNAQQNTFKLEWNDNNLLLPPKKEILELKKKEYKNLSSLIDIQEKKLDESRIELSKWSSAEKFLELSKEIKEICKENDPEGYIEHLELQLENSQKEYENILKRKNLLTELYNHVSEDILKVHEKIISINPLWVSMLKKIVVNPRFMEANISTQTYRNKSHADVTVKLHDSPINVMQVASEAQVTDLQLTFMLAMANSYQWTPNKTLFLDDPTQHHDLVHASGVFDLLRDFIFEKDYQVLLGTHDGTHAKFFQRKLQNENIETKIWRLIAGQDGVNAELIS